MKEGKETWPAVRAQVTTEDGETLDVLMTMAEESGLKPKELLRAYQEEATDQAARRVLVFVYLSDPFGMELPKYEFDIDGRTHLIVLNATAWENEERTELKSLLRYIAGDGKDGDPFIEELDEAVEKANKQVFSD